MPPLIHTYADVIRHGERFLRNRGVTLDDGAMSHGDIRAAISAAYHEVPGRRTWAYFKRHSRLNLTAPYSTGTVVYDHTGGTYERQLTLTTGTWPTWAVHGEVIIDDVPYRIDDRKSTAVVTLDPRVNPGEDIASTTYELVRTYYTLPNNFVSMGSLSVQDGGELCYVSNDEWLTSYAQCHSTGTPSVYTIMGDPSLLGNMALYLYPAPSAADPLDFIYQARPRPLIQAGYSAAECKGTVSTTADNTTITGFDTAFDDSMVGSIIRVSSNAKDPPTALDGYNVRVDERTIISVPSATSLTVDTGLSESLTKVKYSISDPIDLEPGLLAVFLRCVEKHLAIIFGLANAKGEPLTEHYDRIYERAYGLAGEQDSRVHAPRAVSDEAGWYPWYTIVPTE
jgi:hypothetical protein